MILADVSLLDTPKGLIVYNIAKSGMVGTSSRGFGDLYDRNTGHIVDQQHPQTAEQIGPSKRIVWENRLSSINSSRKSIKSSSNKIV